MESYTLSNFSFVVTYFDESGVWPAVWSSLKDQLNIHFASIKFKESINTMKTLSSLNIKMMHMSENSHLHLYITKLNSTSDLKGNVKERILSNFEKYKNAFFILLMDIDNSDSSVKNALKNFEKIKSELKNPEIKLLPVNLSFGKHNDIISDFFVFLKLRVSSEINSKMAYYLRQIETYKQSKLDNKEATYNYLIYKDNLYTYLQVADFWEDFQKCLEDDLFVFFNFLQGGSSNYSEPYSLLDFSEIIITKKINERNLSNLEYQQYIFYNFVKSCKYLRDYRKLNFYVNKILNQISSLKAFFNSKYHFNFWCFQFTSRLIPYIKSLKSGVYSSYDEEVNIRTQINIYFFMKKFLKNFSQIIKFDIPNNQVFSGILNNKVTDEAELKQQFQQIISSYSDIEKKLIESDPAYSSFTKEVMDNLDEKTRMLVFDKNKFLEEYLNILVNLEKLQIGLNQQKMLIKTHIEKLPILFVLGKNSLIRSTILSILKTMKKEKWDFIFEFLNYILISLINCVEKNEENLRIILEFLNLKFKNSEKLNTLLNVENENSINEILSNYLENFDRKLLTHQNVNINMNNLLNLSFDYSSSDREESNKAIKNININQNPSANFELKIKNISRLKFSLSKIVFNFEDEMNNQKLSKEYFHEELEFLKEESEIFHKLSLNFSDILKEITSHNCLLKLTSVKFILKSGIEGVYSFSSEKDAMKINLKTNNLEVKSWIKHPEDEKKDKENKKSIGTLSNLFHYNTVYSLILELTNFNDFDFKNKETKIFVNSLNEFVHADSSLFCLCKDKFTVKDGFGDVMRDLEGKIKVNSNEVTFEEGLVFSKNHILLELFFFIEDTDYYKAFDKKIDVLIHVKEKNSKKEDYLFVFKESHLLVFQHIFALTHRLRIERNENLLLQSSVNLNLDRQGVTIIIDDKPSELDILQTLNIIKILHKDSDTGLYLSRVQIDYLIDNIPYTFFYPESSIKEKLVSLLNLPYHIKINVEKSIHLDENIKNSPSDGVNIFQEFNVSITIRKYIKEDVLIMIKMKESENWSIIGKSRLIENISSHEKQTTSNYVEVRKLFKLIPLQDGYIKLPEIDFMEFKINPNNFYDMKNVNSLEFLPLNIGAIIEGNEKIVKVYSINSCALRLNFI